MASTPLIVHSLRAHQYFPMDYVPKNTKEENYYKESKFYRCQDAFSVIDYLERQSAGEKLSIEEIRKIQMLLEANESGSHLDYQNERPGSTGSFDKNGDITKEGLKEYKKKLQETKSTVWSSVISFTPEYSEKFVNNKAQAFDTISNTINKFFKDSGLNPDNMEWTCAYHTNTDNRHCHLLFWEKDPKYLDSYGRRKYHPWKLPKESLEGWKSDISIYHQMEPLKYLSLRDDIKQNVTDFLKGDNTYILENLNRKLSDIKSYQYARITRDNQLLVNRTVTKLINSDPKTKELYNNYFNALMKTQADILTNCQEVGVKPNKEQSNFFNSRVEEFYNRCGNSVLKLLKDYRTVKEETNKKKIDIKNKEFGKEYYKTHSSARNSKVIRQISQARRTSKGKIGMLMQSIVVTLATDISRERDSIDAWRKKGAIDDDEKEYKDN